MNSSLCTIMFSKPFGQKLSQRMFSQFFIEVNPKKTKPGMYLDDSLNLNFKHTLTIERYKKFINNPFWLRDSYRFSYSKHPEISNAIQAPKNGFSLKLYGNVTAKQPNNGNVRCSLQFLNYNSINMTDYDQSREKYVPYDTANQFSGRLFDQVITAHHRYHGYV